LKALLDCGCTHMCVVVYREIGSSDRPAHRGAPVDNRANDKAGFDTISVFWRNHADLRHHRQKGSRLSDRLTTRIGRLTLRNPVICGSGEPVMTEAGIRAALAAGAAGGG